MNLAVCLNPSVDTLVWIDQLHPGETNRANREEHFPGGKGTHVALALNELGATTTLSGFWGGPTGRWIREECAKLGTRIHGTEVDDWNRSCLTFQSQSSMNNTELLGVGPAISNEHAEAYLNEFRQIVQTAEIVNISGSLPKGLSSTFYAGLLRVAASAGVPAVIDFTGEPLLSALEVTPAGIHLNSSESAQVTARKEISEIIDHFRRFAAWICVSDGQNGLYLADQHSCYHAICNVIPEFSSVGCGDCATAGFTFAIQKKQTLEEAAAHAAACGAANLLNPKLGMFLRSDVERLLPDTIVTKIS